MMRSTPIKSDKKTIGASHRKPAVLRKKKMNNETPPIRDTVSETISFVIKGKLTPIKLIEKDLDTTSKGKQPRKCGKVSEQSAKKSVKARTKVQTKTAKKPSAQSNCKKSSEKIVANSIPKESSSTKTSKAENLDKKPKSKVSKLRKAKEIVTKKLKKTPAQKTKLSKKEMEEDEIKKQQTIEQLMKQVNEEICAKNTPKSAKKKSKRQSQHKQTGEPARVKAEADQSTSVQSTIKCEHPDSPGVLSDEIPLKELTTKTIKTEPLSDKEPTPPRTTRKKQFRKLKTKPKMTIIKKRVAKKNDQKCRTKLFGFWNGPKRHRVASLNARAKVHCLYENETRGNILDIIEETDAKLPYAPAKSKPRIKEEVDSDDSEPASPLPTRTLRSVPGLRGAGKHWEMHDDSYSSEEDYMSLPSRPIKKEKVVKPKKEKAKRVEEPAQEPKRRKNDVVMDLKDMVVRKRMASLNATAILAASYSAEKRSARYMEEDDSSCASSEEYFAASDNDFKESAIKKEQVDDKIVGVHDSTSKKVAVIVNQDTDVTITGVYVNSTTRSTHHEGYCSIAGMQYRISATSHTQTAATAVATETLLQSSASSGPDNSNSDSMPSSKSYTPLDALSNMQPPPGPGIQQHHPVLHGQPHMGPPGHVLPMSPGLRHSCSSAFSSPHSTPGYQLPPGHHPPMGGDTGFVHAGYYQPAGPLITVPHGHGQPPLGAAPPAPPMVTKTVPLSEVSSSPSLTSHDPLVPPPPPSSNGDSSDSEVIITSVTTAKEAAAAAAAAASAASAPPSTSHPHTSYRYHQYSNAPPPTYPYSYLPHPYPTPPPPNSYPHHDLCYTPSPYVNVHKYLPYGRRYYPPPPASQQEIYSSGPPPQQLVSVPPPTSSGPPPPSLVEPYPGPQAAMVETYQPPPPPPHYYPPAYGPPSCYSHSPSRAIPYINATYQSCPCPMQSCPKNVITGPLTGESKRSSITAISKDSIPLPPVALALPLEPTTPGPPSPARGSAGMPPPPSPAGATYQPPPAKPESQVVVVQDDCKVEKKRKARIGKAMVRSHIAAANMQPTTMLLMCNPDQNVKREIESPKEKEASEEKHEETKPVPVGVTSEIHPLEEEIKKEEPLAVTPPVELEQIAEEVVELAEKEEEVEPEEEVLPPVVSTVAENVKVKNMKRSLSLSKEKVPDPEVVPPKKKQKIGSYKCLIKKEMSGVKIDNGKQKLIGDQAKAQKTTKRRNSTAGKEESSKRLRLSKPLSLSNFHSKAKDKSNGEVEKKVTKKTRANSKSGPLALDNLFARNNVERIIESVVCEGSPRTQEQNNENAKVADKCGKAVKEVVPASKKSANKVVGASKAKKTGIARRKSKCKEVVVPQEVTRVPRRSLVLPRWSNGWMWEGEPYEGKVFINSDETTVLRKCFPAMRHEEGDKIVPRDCVLLKAGPRKNDLPFVAKIASLWENPDDGEMMMSLLWYYRPEHTEQGRLDNDRPDEVFASRHKDSNSVACIDDKCYVLTFNEYCRYRKEYKRIEAEIEEPPPCIPNPEPYPRSHRQPPKTQISPEMVFFCRRVYDFRQKRIMKNPT